MIAIDAMGGDNAPQAPVLGALEAAKSGIAVLLFGDVSVIERELESVDQAWRSYPITLIPTSQVIEMGEEPVSAVRSKQDSSLVCAVGAVKKAKAQAVISAGNSGALMAASLFLLGREEGIERPAIAGLFPTATGQAMILDIGANTDCRAQHLVQFAQLGVRYAAQTLALSDVPRVALLSNGEEKGKGSTAGKEAYELMESLEGIQFVGNVEPHDIFAGRADVVVCDGFAGNILLKTFESTGEFVLRLYDSMRGEEKSQAGIRAELLRRIGWQSAGGARLLGVNGVVMVSHGRSTAQAMYNAIVTTNQHVHANQKSMTQQRGISDEKQVS